jgi:DMSO/TMAO reductase YedYZ heme-binding membrane subunit
MDFNPKNILVFAVLLGGIAHVMIFQDGYWNNFMWISAALCVIIPVTIYKYLKINQHKNARRRRLHADI